MSFEVEHVTTRKGEFVLTKLIFSYTSHPQRQGF